MEQTRFAAAAKSSEPDAPEAGRAPKVRTLDSTAPLRWLARGWDDFRATGFRGAFYGAIFALMGTLISIVYETRWQLTMGLTAGFFLVGPFVCTGIYELSRQRAPLYQEIAHITIETGRPNVQSVLNNILAQLEQFNQAAAAADPTPSE